MNILIDIEGLILAIFTLSMCGTSFIEDPISAIQIGDCVKYLIIFVVIYHSGYIL